MDTRKKRNIIKRIHHELNYLKPEDFLQVFVFLLSVLPSVAYTIYIKASAKDIWLICEDKEEARDNGFVFFEYLNKIKSDVTSYYAIDYESPDYEKVRQIGRAVKYGSIFHWMLYFASNANISTQKSGRPNAAVGYVLERSGLLKKKFVFLQHGITINKATWLFYENTKMRLFMCGAKPEYDYVKQLFGYPEGYVEYVGFCRFDEYHNIEVNERQILLIPSWREWIGSKNEYSSEFEDVSVFEKTEYFQKYQSLINNKSLIEYLETNDLILFFYPHRNMQQFTSSFSTESERIRIVSNKDSDIRRLLIESAVMITDYSSVALDFAYMKKPVIYYQFDEERFYKAQYERGYFNYRKANLGKVFTKEEDVVNELISLYKNDLQIGREAEEAHRTFFPLFDNNNCKRTYEAIKRMY